MGPMRQVARLLALLALCVAGLVFATPPARAADPPPAGQMTCAVHVTLAPRWLDPGETEGAITPFMVLYADPRRAREADAGRPAAAEPGRVVDRLPRRAHLRLRAAGTARFHNGEPVTAEDVKFSFERYKGGAATLLKEKVKEVRVVDARRVRFVLKEPWPDFMTFYGTTATGAGWVVPKKYVERVGEEGFKKAPIGAGPYRFVTLDARASSSSWRPSTATGARRPASSALVLRERPRRDDARRPRSSGARWTSPTSSTGPVAEEVRRTPGLKLTAVAHQRHVLPRLRRSVGSEVALGRPRGCGWPPAWPSTARPSTRPSSSASPGSPAASCRGAWSSRCPWIRIPTIRRGPSSCWPRRAIRNGFDGGDFTPNPPYFSHGRGHRQQPGRGRHPHQHADDGAGGLPHRLAREEAARRGPGGPGPAGNAATRIEALATKGGLYASGVVPEVEDLFQRQARELDRKKREEMLHQIQRILHERVVFAPIWENGFIRGVGPRVDEPALDADPPLPVHGAVRGAAAQALTPPRRTCAYQRISADCHIDLPMLAPDLFTANASAGAEGADAVRHRRARRSVLDLQERRLVRAAERRRARPGRSSCPGRTTAWTSWPRPASTRTASKGIRRPTDPALRAKDMDRDGVQAEVIFGILGAATRLNDPRRPTRCSASTTTGWWTSASHDRDRFIGLACLPYGDIDAAVKEIHRVAKLGLRGIELSCSWDMEPMWHPDVGAALEGRPRGEPAAALPHVPGDAARQSGQGDGPEPRAPRSSPCVSGFQMNLDQHPGRRHRRRRPRALSATCASRSARAASAGSPTRSIAWTSSGRTASATSASR